jgi:SAM-dependent methyltransferase
VRFLGLKKDELVVDIGSNVGVLLRAFKDEGMRIQGVDPAANIVMLACERGIDTICDFFNTETVENILAEKGKASVVTATNVFAHVDNLYLLMDDISRLLKNDGVFIFEAPYFVNLLKHVEYDTIYHEHLSYLSVKPLISFFKKFRMEIFNIEQVDIHGGSFRVYIGKVGAHKVSDIVSRMLKEEDDMHIYSREVLLDFAQKVEKNRRELVWMLQTIKQNGQTIAGVSAPAKGMTLLNYCRIGNETLDFITEKSALKIGRFTPGAHIPVEPDSYLLEKKPSYVLLLAWNFSSEIISNLNEFRKQGGKFIIPIPAPRIVN